MHNAYGARVLIQKYCGLKSDRRLRIPEIIWQHGWLTPFHNRDPDTLVGESAQTSYLLNETYLVAREDQAHALRDFGILDSHAIGLPFAYALAMHEEQNRRTPRSVVVMPSAHGSVSSSTSLHLDTSYINYLLEHLDEFGTIKVVMNCDDLENGRSELWENHGFRVEPGACESDDSSFPRLIEIFSQTEVVTTNGFGSHIVYAAAAGCKVSVAGPGPENISSKNPWSAPFYVNRPDLVKIEYEILADTNCFLKAMGVFTDPVDSVDLTAWARSQIGFDRVLTPQELRTLLNVAFRRHRPLGRRWGLHEIRKKARRLRQDMSLVALTISSNRKSSPWAVLGNLVRVFSPRPQDKPVKIKVLDAPMELETRHQSSDWSSLRATFVSRQYDAIDLGSPDRILVAGSYVGYSLVYFANRFPSARIVGAESDPENYLIGERNTRRYPKVRVRHIALWPEDGDVSLLRSSEGWQSSKVIRSVRGLPRVEAWTLGRLLREENWPTADLIVLDIEGSEYAVLEGASEQLKKVCSKLLVHFTHRLAHRKGIEEIAKKLTDSDDGTHEWFGDFALFSFRS
jgi:FkbM family methyltransferase